MTVLQSHGHEAAIETVSERAISRIDERRPDVVILDVMFPENDTAGFEVRRPSAASSAICPAVLTAVNQSFPAGLQQPGPRSDVAAGRRFLEKPVDLDLTLTRRVAALFAVLSGVAKPGKGEGHRVRLGLPPGQRESRLFGLLGSVPVVHGLFPGQRVELPRRCKPWPPCTGTPDLICLLVSARSTTPSTASGPSLLDLGMKRERLLFSGSARSWDRFCLPASSSTTSPTWQNDST